MAKIIFRPLDLSDCQEVQQRVYFTDCRNCDLNFMNLMSWSFLYGTQLAYHHGWLLIRFRIGGHLAYLPPIGDGDRREILEEMFADAREQGETFRLMGVCDHTLAQIHTEKPGLFVSKIDRSYSDYIYRRESLAELSGKKLQSKRNHVNHFIKAYPHYEFLPLQPDLFPSCLELVEKWRHIKGADERSALSYQQELKALQYSLIHFEDFSGRGGVLRVDGKTVAFTYGAPINHDTFDTCVEKADLDYDGAFAMVNREFARNLPSQYVFINREEDLGLEGLRKAKMSYQPEFLIHKHLVMTQKDVELQQLEGFTGPLTSN